MNKREVAEKLNCSTRQVEKYVGAKRLRVIEYRHGKTGREGVYDAAEVARLQAELEQERSQVIGDAPPVGALVAQRTAPPQALALAAQLTSGLDRQHRDAERIIAALAALKPAAANGQMALAEINLKLTLSVGEAAQLCGLSKESLRAAIHAGKLPAQVIAGRRGFTIKRDDLETYVRKL
jgi:excisionase family DNA binding protein